MRRLYRSSTREARKMFLIRVFSILCFVTSVALGRTDTTPPTVPTNLTMTAVSYTTASLNWSPSQDLPNGNNAGLNGYNVYRDGVLVMQVATTSATDPGLVESTTYSYTISAVDNATNESAQSTPISVATPAAALATGLKIAVS